MDDRNHLSDQEKAELWDPAVGEGTPDTAPHRPPPTTLLERQPIRLLGEAPAAILGLAAAIAGLGVGEPLAALAAAIAVVVVCSLLELARQLVTPTADPKVSEDLPLRVAADDRPAA